MKSLRSLDVAGLGGGGGSGPESKLKIEWPELTELWLLGRSPLSDARAHLRTDKHSTLAKHVQQFSIYYD